MGLCIDVGRSRYLLQHSRSLILRSGRFGSRSGEFEGLRGGEPLCIGSVAWWVYMAIYLSVDWVASVGGISDFGV